jgi:hypothetical protein
MERQALCLTLLFNAVIAWNTVYAREALRQLISPRPSTGAPTPTTVATASTPKAASPRTAGPSPCVARP